MTRVWNWRWSAWFVLAACVLLAVLWDVLFWGHPLGISAAIFGGVLVALLVWRSPQLWRTKGGLLAVLLTVLALAALAEETSTLAIVMSCLTVGTLVLVSQRAFSPLTDNVSTWVARWMGLLASLWLRCLRDNVLVGRWMVRHPRFGRMGRFFTALAWWVLPVIAGMIFAGLFSLANPVVARFFGHLEDYINDVFTWLIQLSFLRMFMWVVVAVMSYGLLRYRWGGRGAAGRRAMGVPPVVQSPGRDWLTGPEMIIRLLVVLNLVFAVENVLDMAYLYAGRAPAHGHDL